MNKKSHVGTFIILVIIFVFTVGSFYFGIQRTIEHNNRMKNAVTVTATVVDYVLQYREKVDWYSGAGDDVEKTVTKEPYYTRKLSYTYQGKKYHYATSEYLGGKDQIDILIDSTDPEVILTDDEPGKADFFFGIVFLSIFLIVLLLWMKRNCYYKKNTEI